MMHTFLLNVFRACTLLATMVLYRYSVLTGDIGYLSNVIPSNGVIFRMTPASYNYSWHCAPRRQFVVNLNADVEITVSDGERKTIKQGQVFFLEDTKGKFSVYNMHA